MRTQAPTWRDLRDWQIACQQIAGTVDPKFWPALQAMKDAFVWYEEQIGEIPSLGLIDLGPLESRW